MDTGDWLERWRERRIGFHRSEPHAALQHHWAAVAGGRRGPVLVPLCGKSLDMAWLAGRGHAVIGVEISPLAVREFFEDRAWPPRRGEQAGIAFLEHGPVRLYCADFFALRREHVAPAALVYDRAALVALPGPQQGRYLAQLCALMPPAFKGLLVTLEYDQSEMQGPPFAAPSAALMRHLAGAGVTARLLERRDVIGEEARFRERGVTAMWELTWALERDEG